MKKIKNKDDKDSYQKFIDKVQNQEFANLKKFREISALKLKLSKQEKEMIKVQELVIEKDESIEALNKRISQLEQLHKEKS